MRGYFPTNISDYTINQCKEYLSNYPNGLNADAVRARLSALMQNSAYKVYNAHKTSHVNRNEIASKVLNIIVEKLGVSPEEVTENSNFQNDLGADSLDTTELIMEFEKAFDIEIGDEYVPQISTVGQAIDTVIKIKCL